MADPVKIANGLRDRLRTDLMDSGKIGRPRSYLRNRYQPYMPPGATPEFKNMALQSRTPWLPLVVSVFAKALFVDGYRSADGIDRDSWAWWQANGMDARQTITHRTALAYPEANVLVLPGDPVPVIRPLRVTEIATGWSDPDAEFPDYALVRRAGGWWLYDSEARIPLAASPDDASPLTVDGAAEAHDMGVCPVVRFVSALDDDSEGIIAGLIPVQDRIDNTVFATQVALHYGAFRQRWATGLAIPVDPETGKKVAPFKAAVQSVWNSESSETRFGDFAQTDVSGHLQAYLSAVRTLTSLSQIPPTLINELINLSADALAALYDATTSRVGEFQTIFGESWEQVFRLASAAYGDASGAADTSSQVRWRDTSARSLAATVDALGKLAQMLGVPEEALWQQVPGVTDTDLAEWARLADEKAEQAARLQAASYGLTGLNAEGEPETRDATDVKTKADALGSLIRSGVAPQDAASQVGLDGVEFTGAMPVSLRLPESDASQLEQR